MVLIVALWVPSGAASEILSSVDASRLSEHRQTRLGLYLTARDTQAALSERPSAVFIDVRTPEELRQVGHPVGVDRNIPFAVFDRAPGVANGKMVFNEQFLDQIQTFLQTSGGSRDSEIVLICRSGIRSKHAADLLAQVGFTNVWTVIDGYEGSQGRDGGRLLTGWRGAGLPWAQCACSAEQSDNLAAALDCC